MVELDDPATQQSAQEVEEMPPSVKVYDYEDIDDFSRVILLESDRLYSSFRDAPNTRARANDSCEGQQDQLISLLQTKGTQIDHVIFIVEPLAFARDFLNLVDSHPWHAKISYNPATNILVAKIYVQAHEQANLAFCYMLKTALKPMGLDWAINDWGRTTLSAADGTIKEADAGWSPRRGPRGAPKRPSMVLEVGWSETSARLRRDAHFWVDPARGEAKTAFSVKLHANKLHITIDQWEWNAQTSRPERKASLSITKKTPDGRVSFDPPQPQPQLVIPFELLFLRPVDGNSKERDIVFSTQELVEFASLVWDSQVDL
jgi:hypothetical protein